MNNQRYVYDTPYDKALIRAELVTRARLCNARGITRAYIALSRIRAEQDAKRAGKERAA